MLYMFAMLKEGAIAESLFDYQKAFDKYTGALFLVEELSRELCNSLKFSNEESQSINDKVQDGEENNSKIQMRNMQEKN